MMGPGALEPGKTVPLLSAHADLTRYVRLEFGDETPAWLLAELAAEDRGREGTVSENRLPWVASIRRIAKSIAAFLL